MDEAIPQPVEAGVTTHAGVAAPHAAAPAAHGDPELIDISGSMMVLTWVTFGLLAAVLYKVAWKPILMALDKREEELSRALDNAEKIRLEMAAIEATRQRLVDEADAKARDIVEAARRAATDLSATIEAKAREESAILLENAQREIRAAHQKAVASLRKESADLAIVLARKVLGDQLDEPRSRALTDQLIQNV